MNRVDFRTTHWSMVVAARDGEGTDARAALAALCEAYWYPLYAYARRRGRQPAEAEDLTQGFFAQLLEKEWVDRADPDRGRFRAFLLTAFKRHMGHERDRERAQKRGGGRILLSLDFGDGERRFASEPSHDLTPEREFDRRWALTLLEHVVGRLRTEMAAMGRGDVFEELRGFLPGGGDDRPYAAAGESLGLTPGAVKVAVHRLRVRYRDRLRDEIAQTVAGPEDVDREIEALLAALAG